MYESPQKKNSSWTPSTVQKKGKSPSKLGHFSIQPKPNQSSESSQEIGEYSRDAADRLTANVMRSLQTREQEIAEESIQPKFQSPWAPTFEPPPPLPESPASKLKGAFAPVSKNPIQRQCAECAKEENEQKGEERKDLEETGIQTKLTVGAPGDSYEQEADRMASQVMSMSAPADSSASVQRQLDTNHPHHPKQIWKRAQSIKPVMQRQIDPRVQMREMIQRAHQIDGNQASSSAPSEVGQGVQRNSLVNDNRLQQPTITTVQRATLIQRDGNGSNNSFLDNWRFEFGVGPVRAPKFDSPWPDYFRNYENLNIPGPAFGKGLGFRLSSQAGFEPIVISGLGKDKPWDSYSLSDITEKLNGEDNSELGNQPNQSLPNFLPSPGPQFPPSQFLPPPPLSLGAAPFSTFGFGNTPDNPLGSNSQFPSLLPPPGLLSPEAFQLNPPSLLLDNQLGHNSQFSPGNPSLLSPEELQLRPPFLPPVSLPNTAPNQSQSQEEHEGVPSTPSVSENPIQRQCAECASEEQEQKGEERKDLDEIGIQTKLTIGAPGDTYEQEADRVASQVMSMPDNSPQVQQLKEADNPNQIWQRAQSIKPVVQRQIDPRVQMGQMIQRAHQIDGNQAQLQFGKVSLVQRSSWDNSYKNKRAWSGEKYEDYKAGIELKDASDWGGQKVDPVSLTLEELGQILKPEIQTNEDEEQKHQQRLEEYLPLINDAFETMVINTVKTQALYLAHAAGETGTLSAVTEKPNSKTDNYKPFVGRGPLHTTFEEGYIQALAYLEKKAEQLEQVAQTKEQEANNWETQLSPEGENYARAALALADARSARKKSDLAREACQAIKGDLKEAANPKYSFIFGAAYMHSVPLMRNAHKLGNTASFINPPNKIALENRGMTGKGMSESMKNRAPIKSATYKRAISVLSQKAVDYKPDYLR